MANCCFGSSSWIESNVQGLCHIVAASSSRAKAQDAYNELTCVDSEGSP
jgi:hypothetical protein